MSTTARKTRKRDRHRALNDFRNYGHDELAIPAPFMHPVRPVTPVAERLENQPRQIFGRGFGGGAKPTRYGYTVPMRRRLAAAGVEVGATAADPKAGKTKRSPKSTRRALPAKTS